MHISLGLSINSQRRALTPAVDPFAELMTTLLPGAVQLIAHPLEYGSMFQDRAGTIPVTADGQLVGHVLDAGPGGFHATAASDPARGVFRDVDGKRWVEYNGVNTAYETQNLPAPGVDKVQIFAGVRKLSNATAIIGELGPNTSTNSGSIFFAQTIVKPYQVLSRGTVLLSAEITSGYAPPVTSVLTGTGDISGSSASLRADGIILANPTGSQGAGNYNPSGAYSLYYGARAAGSLFFTGNYYGTLGPIFRFGTNATTEQIEAAEAYYTSQVVL